MLTHARLALSLTLAASVAACGTDDQHTGSDPDAGFVADVVSIPDDATTEERVDATPPPPEFGDTPPSFQPETGVWTYRRGAIEDNTCGAYTWADRDTPFRIPFSDDGTFVVEQGPPWGDFACFITGDAFTCPRRGAGSEPIANTDVTIHYSVGITGDVESATAMSGVQRAELHCEGSQCALAPTVLGVSFPCGWTIPFEVTHVL
jgi:hypothetical protein